MEKGYVGLVLVVLLVSIVLVSGCIETEAPEKGISGEATETATEVPTELNLKIGETAKTSKIEVTVFSAQKTNSYEYYSEIFEETNIETASPGKIFILVDAEIKNIGADSFYVGSIEFSVTDSEGYRYDEELYFGDDGLEMIQELYLNQKMRGKILFEIPEDSQDLKLQYDFGDLFVGTKLASWSIK